MYRCLEKPAHCHSPVYHIVSRARARPPSAEEGGAFYLEEENPPCRPLPMEWVHGEAKREVVSCRPPR